MDDRIVELETKFSFQEDTIHELNEVIIRQQRQIDAMARKLNQLSEQFEELHSQGEGAEHLEVGDEKPPHY